MMMGASQYLRLSLINIHRSFKNSITSVFFVFNSPSIFVLPVGLFFFMIYIVVHHKYVHFSAHKALESVFWCANDGLASDIETCVDQHRTTGFFKEPNH